MIDRVAFVLGETFVGIRRNFWLGLAAIVTSAVALYVLAGMAYVGTRATAYAEGLQERFEMKISLKEGTDRAGIDRTIKYLRMTTGVRSVVWVPRQKAWERLRRESPELAQGLGDDSPLLDALRVRLSDLSQTDAVAGKAKRMSTVEAGGVQYFGDAQNAVARWLAFGRSVSNWLGGLLLAVSGIVIFNAVWMTVASRETEIRVMRLVGASRIVVAFPFVLEGVVQGALGGALAAWGLRATQGVVEDLLRGMKMGVDLAPFPTVFALTLLACIGGGYGGLCSTFALYWPLRRKA